MPFVFISHADPDKKRLTPYIAHLLSTLEDDVEIWIDNPEQIIRDLGAAGQLHRGRLRGIDADEDWWGTIQKDLVGAGCVLAFWSHEACKLHRGIMHHEISVGMGFEKCVQVSIDARETLSIPKPFAKRQILDASRFAEGEIGGFERVVDKVREKLQSITTAPLMSAHRGARSLAQIAQDIETRVRAASDRLLRQMILSNKYREELCVARRDFDDDIREFIGSNRAAYALIGGSGCGKTTLLCSLVESLQSSQGVSVLFYSGSFLYSHDIARSCDIVGRLQADLGLPSAVSRGQIVPYLEEVAAMWRKPLVVVIDGINEYPSPERMLESVNEVIELAGERIKILISCRDHVWKEVTRTRKPYTVQFHNLTSEDAPKRYLEGFTEKELRQAYEKYQREYALKTSYHELRERTRKAFENPLILRMAAMAFKDSVLPGDVPEGSVFDVFYSERIKPDRDVAQFLRKVASMMRGARQDRLPLTQVDTAIAEAGYRGGDISGPFHRLVDLGILYEFDESGVSAVRFTYDRFFEYLLGRALLQDGIEQNLSGILREAADFDSLRKGLDAALLTFNRGLDERGIGIVGLLAENQSEQWREFAAVCLGKMSWDAQHSPTLMRTLSGDTGYWIRWATGQSLRAIFSDCPELCEAMIPLAEDSDWHRREVVAIAVGSLTAHPERAVKVLEKLALDDHWRVRRVVAFSFGELVASDSNAVSHLSRWARHGDWRVREALARSPRPLIRITKELADVVAGLAVDPEPIVRRAVARSMRVLAQAAPDISIDTLHRMADDNDSWVRKTVLKTLASPALASIVDQSSEFRKFSRDPNRSIRWALARSVRQVSGGDAFQEVLDVLARDEDSLVAAAANFTRVFHGRVAPKDDPWRYDPSVIAKFGNEVVYEIAQDTARLRKSREDRTRHWVPDEYLGVETAIAFIIERTVGEVPYWSVLNNLSNDEDEGIRWGVTNLLGRAIAEDRDEALKLLNRLAKDQHYWIRRAVVEAISQMSLEHAVAASNLLVELAEDESAEVRSHVFEACARILRGGVNSDDVLTALKALTSPTNQTYASGERRGFRYSFFGRSAEQLGV